MGGLSDGHARQLAASINKLWSQFVVDGVPMFEPMTSGQMKLIWGVFEQKRPEIIEAEGRQHDAQIEQARGEGLRNGWQPNAMQAAVMAATDQSIDDKTGISDDDWCGAEVDEEEAAEPDDYDPDLEFGFDKDDPNAPASPISRMVAATLGPEHTIVTPLRPIGRDHSLPPKPRTLADADALADELSEVVQAIQEIADGGKMPSINVYNREKPEHLPVWQVLMIRHELASWGDMAHLCGLPYQPKTGMTEDRRRQLDRLKEERKAKRALGGHGRTNVVEREEGRQSRFGTYIPTERELIAELQRQAMGGVMPSVAFFDDARPATWAKAQAHTARLNVTWNDLAKLADLKPNPRGFKTTQPAEPAHA